MPPEAIAQYAYQAYGQVTDFKNFQGNPMPKWEELPPKIQQAWMAASEAVLDEQKANNVPLEEREWAQVRHALDYAQFHAAAGAPGHGQFMLIAKLAKALNLA